MIWPFKKKKVIDLTSSKIPKSLAKRVGSQISNQQDYKDLTSADSGSALGFLGDMASSSSSGNPSSDLEEKDFVRKLDDFEFKIDSLSRRISSVLDRLDLAEKKLSRLEGKS